MSMLHRYVKSGSKKTSSLNAFTDRKVYMLSRSDVIYVMLRTSDESHCTKPDQLYEANQLTNVPSKESSV